MTRTTMTRTLWIHPFNGIAGDMMLGALIDAGADVAKIGDDLETLGVAGWSIDTEQVFRNGIGAINVTVSADEGHVHRTAGDIIEMVEHADLPPRVVERATLVFRALAEAEGHVHRVDPATVHFHEVGGIDAIVDVVGSCLALEQLAVDHIVVAPIALGQGIARSAHGLIPNPAPATVRLLEGIPVRGLDVGVELTTPTGAALVVALADAFGPMPPMSITSSGFGAGDNELEQHPNLLHVVLGDAASFAGDQLTVLETNVDDLSGEYLAHAVRQLLDHGALDAWLTPIQMKHERPAATVHALVQPIDVEAIGAVLLHETGSIGFRAYGVARVAVERSTDRVNVEGHDIRIKVTPHTNKAEFADVVAVARALGRPAWRIAREAEAQWNADNSTPDGEDTERTRIP